MEDSEGGACVIGIHLWARMSRRSLLSLVSRSFFAPLSGLVARPLLRTDARFSLPLPRRPSPCSRAPHVETSPTNILRKKVHEDALRRPSRVRSVEGPPRRSKADSERTLISPDR